MTVALTDRQQKLCSKQVRMIGCVSHCHPRLLAMAVFAVITAEELGTQSAWAKTTTSLMLPQLAPAQLMQPQLATQAPPIQNLPIPSTNQSTSQNTQNTQNARQSAGQVAQRTDRLKPPTPKAIAPASERLTMDEIELRLMAARAEESYYEDQKRFTHKSTDVALGIGTANAPVSRIDDNTTPLGLDASAITKLPTLESAIQAYGETVPVVDQPTPTSDASKDVNVGIDPNAYLPTYAAKDSDPDSNNQMDDSQQTQLKRPNLVKRLYNRLFNDGVDGLARLEVTIYQVDDSEEGKYEVDGSQEPYANIKAALSDIKQETSLDFRTAAPRLREAAEAAARAVGYYGTEFRLVNHGAGKIDVIIESLGDPVTVASQVVEIRGAGADNEHFVAAKDAALPKTQDLFHHGEYTKSKQAIDDLRWQHGFFEGRWLNEYVDVILPDNTADVNLVYDTGSQYSFDEVVFFTVDPDTGELTADPAKLPVDIKLLQKMVTFDAGDAYDRSKVSALSGELLTTRYFNAANVDTVLPNLALVQGGKNEGLNFEQIDKGETAQTPTDEQATAQDSVTVVLDEQAGITAEIEPIDFSPSQEIIEKLDLVTNKAQRLYDSPDNRVLSGESAPPTSLLGKVSHAVSNLVKAILPDESKDEAGEITEGAARAELAGRKTPDDVYRSKKVPLYVFVLADKPRDVKLGVGYGSDTGVRVTGRFEHNLLNRQGYQAGMQVSGSRVEKTATAYLSRPLRHPNNDKLIANVTYQEKEIDQGSGEYELSSRSLVTGLSRNIVRPSGWNRTYSIRYRLDELDTNAPRHTWVNLPVQFAENRPTQEALLLGYGMSKTVADNLANPLRGFRQSYSLDVGVGGVVSDTNMAIARMGLGWMYSFGDNRYGFDRAHQVIAKLDLGYIWADNFDAVPYKLRFFAGGDQSLRGYNYESLSPVSPSGYLTGGQSLAIGSLEYNYEVKEGLRAAIFGDVGGAYDKNFGGDTKIGAGVGLRWASPVGSVRADIATGVGEKGTPIKLHFMIGIPF